MLGMAEVGCGGVWGNSNLGEKRRERKMSCYMQKLYTSTVDAPMKVR